MPELHLRKHREKKKKLKIKIKKCKCFAHDAAYSDDEDLSKRTILNNEGTYKVAINPTYD